MKPSHVLLIRMNATTAPRCSFSLGNRYSSRGFGCSAPLTFPLHCGGGYPFQIFQDASFEALVDDIICQMAEVLRPLHRIEGEIQTAQTKHVFIEFARESLNPNLQLFCYPGLKQLGQGILGPVSLVARRFIDQRDDANAREAGLRHADEAVRRAGKQQVARAPL